MRIKSDSLFFLDCITSTETRHLWGSQGWWCTALWVCSGPEPRPGPAAARWCPDSSTSLHSDSSWSAPPRVRPMQPSREGTAEWRSWRRSALRLRRTQAALELSECREDKCCLWVFTWIRCLIWDVIFLLKHEDGGFDRISSLMGSFEIIMKKCNTC